jgi:hypothetical protein
MEKRQFGERDSKMTKPGNSIPIYTTVGDYEAFMIYPMLYNLNGEWIGFVTGKREVYDVRGTYVGWMTNDPRILRKRSYDFTKPKMTPPPAPSSRAPIPARAPLPPMMSELGFDTIDVLEEEPERLPTLDFGELRDDMD